MDVTQRFTSRVDDYVKYRPTYPPTVVEALKKKCGLRPGLKVADVGFGTGIFAALLLREELEVWGIEPNAAMRSAGEKHLSAFPLFHSMDGRAEAIPLPSASVDFVTAAQAAHWFDAEKTRPELARVLKPEGWLVLLWNDRLLDASRFLVGYEAMLQRYALDYKDVEPHGGREQVRRLFGGDGFVELALPSHQILDWAALRGRVESSSYAPQAGHPHYEPMVTELRRLYDENAEQGTVRLEYLTRVYFGHLHTEP